MTQVIALPDFAGGPVAAEDNFGDMFYGMYPSISVPGDDRPFAYNADTNTFAPISGITSLNLPASQSPTGAITPATVAQVGGRIIFTHPGFNGGVTLPAAYMALVVNTTNGSNQVAGPAHFAGAVAGDFIQGPGILVNTKIQTILDAYVYTTGTGTASATTFTVTSATGLVVGMTVYGPSLESLVTGVAGTTITIPNGLVQSFTSANLIFVGSTITISANATATAVGVQVLTFSPVPSAKFGWLDVSGFSATIIANAVGAVKVMTGNPNIVGIQPGMTITGPSVPANTTILAVESINFTVFGQIAAQSQIVQLGTANQPHALAAGQLFSGPGIPAGTTIISYDPTVYQITLSNAATTAEVAVTFNVSGALIITSAANSSSTSQNDYTVAGGTIAAPLWGSGDLSVNPIAGAAPAVFVAQFAGRAYFGVNTSTSVGVQASDAGAPCIQTNINQTLTFNDGEPVTAGMGLALFNQLGGIISSLMVFQGASNIRQITGDFSLGTIAVNSLQTVTGTLAPNSIASTPKGLLFAAPDGLRIIDFDARISDPIGLDGLGITLAFVNAVTPSRMAADYNQNVYRITITWQPPLTVQSIWGSAQRTDEFWLHIRPDLPVKEARWSGPHTSLCDQACAWPGAGSFLVAPSAARGSFYRSDPYPRAGSTYSEFGVQLSCTFQTVLLPDSETQNTRSVVETTLFLGIQSGSEEILVTATDDAGQQLDQAYVWIGPFSTPMLRQIPWHNPLVFRQFEISLTAGATAQLQLGAINIREQLKGYPIEYPPSQEFILGQSILGGSDVLGP
jgi:hypothetical protein